MDTQNLINGAATVLCIATILIPVAAVVIYGVRSRMAYAARIRELMREGAYESWGRPPMANRLRLMGAFMIVASCGMYAWVALLLTNRDVALSAPALAIVGVMFLSLFVIGFTLQWLAVHPSGGNKSK